ncbi:hypothetical protein J2W32_004684 [Variovorax boronicumulans]|uniref:Uncharacterized protein n=1 Tax=Variovorax boronicumulans TaxID=436515 RepID=A0AAW8D6E7_9BURK|nr:hypothetical protein [Variovorax boronicumulans]MDQ0055624.1 hypothetical protein [Variovorax boronicumulans]
MRKRGPAGDNVDRNLIDSFLISGAWADALRPMTD